MIHESAARGFARAPADYERGRPDYPAEAIAWLAQALALGPGRRVLDLAAGTGKLTRALAATGAEVVAVEPVDEMRAFIEAEALAGTAEAIPLPAAAVDAVTVGQAFHWFRGDEALAEIHRVLRPHGRLGLVWNLRDSADPFMAALSELLEPHRGTAPAVRAEARRDVFARSELFGPLEEAEFPLEHELDHEGVVARVTSISFIAALPLGAREGVVDAVRELVAGEPEPLALAYRTLVYWCERR